MKAITFTIVTHKAQSLNYGETIGNVSTLKKLTIGNETPRKLITYVSDKALKYDIKRIGRENFDWRLMDNNVSEIIKGCVENIQNGKGKFNYQKFYEEMVKNYEEFDLFGGMFADIGGVYSDKKKKEIEINNVKVEVDIDTTKLQRTAPVRVTNAYSISEFVYDSNLLHDIDAYNRYIQFTAGEKKQTLAYSDEHRSHYVYTILIDLEQIGCVYDLEIERWRYIVSPSTIIKRIKDLLDILFFKFHRNIRGRTENLTPVFVIGGLYSYKHPIFHNSLDITERGGKIEIKGIQKVLKNLQPNSTGNTYLYKNDGFVDVDDVDNHQSISKLEELKDILDKVEDEIKKDIKQKVTARIGFEDLNNLTNEKITEWLEKITGEKKSSEIEEMLTILTDEKLEEILLLNENEKKLENNQITLEGSSDSKHTEDVSSMPKNNQKLKGFLEKIGEIKNFLEKIKEIKRSQEQVKNKNQEIVLNINGKEKKLKVQNLFGERDLSLWKDDNIYNSIKEQLNNIIQNENKNSSKNAKNQNEETSQTSGKESTFSESNQSKKRGRPKKGS